MNKKLPREAQACILGAPQGIIQDALEIYKVTNKDALLSASLHRVLIIFYSGRTVSIAFLSSGTYGISIIPQMRELELFFTRTLSCEREDGWEPAITGHKESSGIVGIQMFPGTGA
jgi:hypothetical protein